MQIFRNVLQALFRLAPHRDVVGVDILEAVQRDVGVEVLEEHPEGLEGVDLAPGRMCVHVHPGGGGGQS